MLIRSFTRIPPFDCPAGVCPVPGCTARGNGNGRAPNSHGVHGEEWYLGVVDTERRVALSFRLFTPWYLNPVPGDPRSFFGADLTVHVGYFYAREDDTLQAAMARLPEKCDLLDTCWGGAERSSGLQADALWRGIEEEPDRERGPSDRLWQALEDRLAEESVPPPADEGSDRIRALRRVEAAMVEAGRWWKLS